MHLAYVLSNIRRPKGGATCMYARDMFAVKVNVFPERGTHLAVVACVFKVHRDAFNTCSVEYSASQGGCNMQVRTRHVRSESVCIP